MKIDSVQVENWFCLTAKLNILLAVSDRSDFTLCKEKENTTTNSKNFRERFIVGRGKNLQCLWSLHSFLLLESKNCAKILPTKSSQTHENEFKIRVAITYNPFDRQCAH